MKTSSWFFLAFFVLFLPGISANNDLSLHESLGPLRLGLKSADVVKFLGSPTRKDKPELWEAVGEWVQEWHYPEKGLSLQMASAKKGGTQTVRSLSASKGCSLQTARGIQIGSREAEVRKAYGRLEDHESSVRGKSFVADSLYGGVIFHFEKDRVAAIFIGAAAE